MDDLNDPNSLIENAETYDHNEKIVTDFIYAYFTEMNEVEKRYLHLTGTENSEEEIREAIEEQKSIHDRFCDSSHEYWHPCSVGSSEAFNPDNIVNVNVLTDGRNEFNVHVLHFGQLGTEQLIAFRVETFEGKPRIKNQYY